VSSPLEPPPARAAAPIQPVLSPRAVARTVLVVVAVVVALYVVYLLRRPIGWVLISIFLAVALSGPVNLLHRRMRRGFAILVVYLGLLLVPIGIAGLIVPPLVTQAHKLATHLPSYVADVRRFVERNKTLNSLERDYDITGKLEQQAAKLPSKIGGAASLLSGVGLGVVNSLFKLLTILVLTAFLLGSGRRWVHAALQLQPTQRRERIERMLDHMAAAVGNYVGGALAQATLAGVTSFIVLLIIGVPFAAALAVVMFVADLIPLVGATIGAVLIGIVTLFGHFPAGTIAWTVWSIVYQQIENNLIQPQIQRRAVNVHPFAVLVAVLFGATLLGVIGALVAIPVAASVQIAIREWWDWRRAADRASIAAPS
jgi:predicted PurR-regulated permease PerM